jgi:hypothetical protein
MMTAPTAVPMGLPRLRNAATEPLLSVWNPVGHHRHQRREAQVEGQLEQDHPADQL